MPFKDSTQKSHIEGGGGMITQMEANTVLRGLAKNKHGHC